MEYSEVKEQIKQKLPVQKEFGDSENLLELGLSSIVIMRLVNQWRKQGVKVAFGTLMEHPTLKEWWKIIQKGTKKKGKKAKAEKRDIIMERDMRKPFPLTDVQYAYWVGREDNQVLGELAAMHIWNLMDMELSLNAFKKLGVGYSIIILCCELVFLKMGCKK